ncbi:hypothetical protein L3Q82_005939 [Scortum barcoo]|uniref:Uncharacterized protein n=1 Tax=Scortum barcoo TaxID=214431 RepID=A0ACB8X399_9TELE|nr:hypothetical protein L3Q82_005939 [Scortum barcoo]
MGTTESTEDLFKDFADWCLWNNLQINAGKTKELVVDFRRRSHSPPAPVSIQGTDIDTVKSYKYLGVHLNDSLDWSDNTNALVKKGNSRLFLLRRLRSFGVQGPLLRTFYDSVVASAIFFGIVCWASSITDRDRRRMDRLNHGYWEKEVIFPATQRNDTCVTALPKWDFWGHYNLKCVNTRERNLKRPLMKILKTHNETRSTENSTSCPNLTTEFASTPAPDDSQRAAEITRSLGEMIVKDLQPISIVEDRGFNAFVKTLDPHYKVPGRKHMMEGTIADLYNSCKEKVKAALQHAYSVVLTTDMPSSASPGSPAPTSSSAPVKKGIWADFDTQVLAAQQQRTTEYKLRSLKVRMMFVPEKSNTAVTRLIVT